MNELVRTLIVALLGALGVWVTKTLIPYIKSITTLSTQEKINGWVKIAVTAAKQLISDNDEKYVYVEKYLRARGVNMSELELKALIESAVQRMKAGVL